MTAIEHFSSTWTPIRGAAATFVGALLGQLPIHKRRTLNTGLIAKGTSSLREIPLPQLTEHIALIGLLKQKDADVRRRCAISIGLLYDY